MTEYEWLTCEDRDLMLRFLRRSDVDLYLIAQRHVDRIDNRHQHLLSLTRRTNKLCCDVIREVIGTPFWKTLRRELGSCNALVREWLHAANGLKPPWCTPRVTAFAKSIVKTRCYEDVPLLADYLVESGCNDEILIRHFQQEMKCPLCSDLRQDDFTGNCLKCGASGKAPGWIPKPVPCQEGCWVLRLLV